MQIKSKVPSNYRGLSLIDYLVKRFTYLSKELWLSRILNGAVLINDKIVSADFVISTDDSIAYTMPDYKEEPADLNYKIIYEDEFILAIDKPGNLLVHYNRRNFTRNLIYQLRQEHDPTYPNADIINRLDRETSGIVLVSKKNDVVKKMSSLFVNRQVLKTYIAVVHGAINTSGVIDAPIGKNLDSRIGSKQKIDGVKAKEAITKYRLLERVADNFSLVELNPETGRTHQLRVHLASIGHPIVGDKFYSISDEEFFEMKNGDKSIMKKLIISRQALHCSTLSFIHPFTGKELIINAEIPKDMKELILNKKINL